MKLGEIKLATLAMIFPNEIFEVDASDDEKLKEMLFNLKSDANYSDLLAGMTYAINRCFSSLEQKGVLPTKEIQFCAEDFSLVGKNKRMVDLRTLGDDVLKISRVVYHSNNDYIPRCTYTRQSTHIILVDDLPGRYTIVYTPKIKRLSVLTSNAYVIDIPDEIMELVPYFVKSEILRVENSSEASVARNMYEQLLDELDTQQDDYQYGVEDSYSINMR